MSARTLLQETRREQDRWRSCTETSESGRIMLWRGCELEASSGKEAMNSGKGGRERGREIERLRDENPPQTVKCKTISAIPTVATPHEAEQHRDSGTILLSHVNSKLKEKCGMSCDIHLQKIKCSHDGTPLGKGRRRTSEKFGAFLEARSCLVLLHFKGGELLRSSFVSCLMHSLAI